MNDLNSVAMIGRLVKDSELKYTKGGVPILSFTVAVNKSVKDPGGSYVDKASFLDCILWGKLGESIGKYMTKGKRVAVDGEIEQQRWETSDGEKRSKMQIVARGLQIIDSDKRENQKPRELVQDDLVHKVFSDDIPF